MQNVMKRSVTATVVAATISWSIGLSSLIAPLAARAAVTGGTLVKASTAAVYYVGTDMKRYVFPNEKTYKTWYSDFSGVMIITDAELASMPIGGNVTYKPGTRMAKITTDPKTYAVAAHGVLRWVKTEAVAVALYGANWNQQIDDVSDAFFTNYTVGADINSASDFDRAAASTAATSISVDKGNMPTTTVSNTFSVVKDSTSSAGFTFVGRTGASVLKFNATNNGSSSMTIDSLTFHRSGPGVLTDLTTVTLYKNSFQRIGSPQSFNSSTHDVTITGLNLPIAAGETAKLSMIVGFAASPVAGDQHTFTLTDFRSGASSANGLPITGATITASGSNGGMITITKSGSAPLSNVKAGGLQQKIAEFKATVSSTEDVRVLKVALANAGTMGWNKLSNITLKQAGATIASVAGFDTYGRATIVFPTSMFIENGASRTFDVYADISADARSNETIFTYLDAIGDMTSIGQTYGFGVAHLIATSSGGSYDGASCALGTGNCSTVQVEAGRFTTTFNGPAAKDIASNAKDVELFNFTIAAQSNLEVRRTELQVTANVTGNCDLIDDMKIVDTASGAVIAGPVDLSTGSDTDALCESALANGTDVVAFTETWNMASGQSRTFKVTADIASTFPAAGTIQIALGDGGDIFDTDGVRNLDNNTFLTTTNNDFVPSVNVTGNIHTVRTPSLTVATSSNPVSQTYIQGTQNAQLLGVSLKAGDAGEVRVTSLVMKGYADVDAGGTFVAGTEGAASIVNIVQTAKLMNGATQLGDTKSPTAAGVVTFDNLNLTIAAGQTVNLVMSGTLAGSIASVDPTADRIKFEIVDDSDVSASDKDGNSLGNGTTTAPNIVGPDADGINGLTGNTGVLMTIALAGTVTVALAPDDSETEAGLLVGGASNAVLAKYKFNAANEELKLVKARIMIPSPFNAAVSISLYDGATLVGGPASVDGTGNADFSNMNFVIPKDGSKVLTAKGNLSSVGSAGATTGSLATATLDNAGSPTLFEVRGTSAGSSTLITSVGSDTVGRAKVLRRTKPTVALTTLPSTVLTSGTMSLMRFTVSADASGDVALKRLTASFSEGVAAAGTTFGIESASSVRRVGDSSNVAGTATLLDGSGLSCAGNDTSCTFKASFASEETIAAGTSRSYDIRVVITGTIASGDSLSMTLLGDSAVATGYVSVGAAVAQISTATLTGVAGTASVTINGTAITAVFDTDLTTTATNLAANINANGTVSPVVTAVGAGAVVTITSDIAGQAFTVVDASSGGMTATIATPTPNASAAPVSKIDATNTSTDDGTEYNFVWSDMSAAPHIDSPSVPNALFTGSADWVSGSLVKVVPTDGQTVSK